jgi:long-chain fatty acid transport protein
MRSLARLSLAVALAAVLTTGLFANGLNLNGFGARATAMGGAYVSLANDVTAVFWNPAGLALIKQPTFGLAGDLLVPKSTYSIGDVFSMETEKKYYPAGLVGYAHPIGDRVVVGLGAYTLSGLGADWDNPGLEALMLYGLPAGSVVTPSVEPYDWRSFIGSITVAPSIAVKLSDMLYFGASFNVNYGFFQTDQWGETQTLIAGPPPYIFNFGQASLNVKGWGYGATFGLMVKPSEMISFGVTYRLASKIKMKGTTEIENMPTFGNYLPGTPDLPEESDAELTATSPMWLAGGVSIKPVENLTLAFDLQWTNWKKLDVLSVELLDPAWNAIGVTENELDLQWADKMQIRCGIEYVMGNFALRGGYYYDPAPAPDATLNILVPSFNYNSIAGGFGYKTGGLSIDLGVEYLMGKDRNVTAGAMPGSYTMKILVPVLGLSYAF